MISSYKKESYLLLVKFLEIHFLYFSEKITPFIKYMLFEGEIFLYIFVHIVQNFLIGLCEFFKKKFRKNFDRRQIPPMAEEYFCNLFFSIMDVFQLVSTSSVYKSQIHLDNISLKV